MKTPLERAITLVKQQYKRNREAVQLAKLASLAARVEPHLLRRLRLDLLPDADVGIEADLWFGPLVESRGVRTIVLNRYVVELLREKLAKNRQLLQRVIALTKQAHAQAAKTIRLEERLTALAVLNKPDAPQKIDEALRPALRTMQVGGEGARQLAQWAMRALSQAHPRVRESRNAIMLGLSATVALGGRPILREVPKVPGDLGDMSWLLQGAISVPPTRIGVELVADGVAFAEPGGGQPQLELPATSPLVLSLAWKTDGGDTQMLVEAVPGRTVELDADVTHVELRTLSGDKYQLSVESSPEATSEDLGASHFNNDVFISYAGSDDAALEEHKGQKGWVTMLHETLRAMLSQAMGRGVTIWTGARLSGADVFSPQLSKTAVMVSVFSPAYLNSEWCIREVEQFCQVAEQTGGVLVDNRSRVFRVMTTPIDHAELEQRLPPGVRDTLGYEFYEVVEGERFETLYPGYADVTNAVFKRKVYELANDIAETLSRLAAQPLPQPPAKFIKDKIEKVLDPDPATRKQQLALLRTAFIPWLVTINPQNDEPMRRVARRSDLPEESLPLVDALTENRLLVRNQRNNETWIKVAHEALLRQWDVLVGWLQEERAALKEADALERQSREWKESGSDESWLWGGQRLQDALALAGRPGFRKRLERCSEFLERSRKQQEERDAEKLRIQTEKLKAAEELAAVQAAARQQAERAAARAADSIDPTMDELRRKRAELDAEAEHLNKQLEGWEQESIQEGWEMSDQQEKLHRLAAVNQSIMKIDAELRMQDRFKEDRS